MFYNYYISTTLIKTLSMKTYKLKVVEKHKNILTKKIYKTLIMINNIKRDKKLLRDGKIFNIKTTIHYLIDFNVYAKLSDIHKQVMPLYSQCVPMIRYQHRMLFLKPYWFQYKKRKKYYEKLSYYNKLNKKIEAEINKLNVIYNRERNNLMPQDKK